MGTSSARYVHILCAMCVYYNYVCPARGVYLSIFVPIKYIYVLCAVCIYQCMYQQIYVRPVRGVYLSMYVPTIICTSCERCVFINIYTNNYMYVLCVVCIYQYMYILSDCLGVIYLLGVLLRLLLLSSSVIVCHYILFFSYSRTG